MDYAEAQAETWVPGDAAERLLEAISSIPAGAR